MLEDTANKQRDNSGRFLPGNDLRFKKGEVANPDGRPANKKYLSEIAREQLEEIPRGELEGRNADILIVLALIRKALGGDTKAIEMLHDWTEGKVPDKLKLESPISILYKLEKSKE